MIPKLNDACQKASQILQPLQSSPRKIYKAAKNRRLRTLLKTIEKNLSQTFSVHEPSHHRKNKTLSFNSHFKAVAWNLERGKNIKTILEALKKNSFLKNADFYFLTEVDWGMGRSHNLNIPETIGKELGLYSYFAPSYFNLTRGHGSERLTKEWNSLGLHGKAILSRYPLTNLKSIPLPNATNKYKSKEIRIGQKRALTANFIFQGKKIHLACIHLDAFSSPQKRARQMKSLLKSLPRKSTFHPTLLGGDWNTNTINSISTSKLLMSVLKQMILPGIRQMVNTHHIYPQRIFDRKLFELLEKANFDFEGFNEEGVGTYDLLPDNMEVGQMANDRFPAWALKLINRLITTAGGRFSLKLDWFAGRHIKPINTKVIRLKKGRDYMGPIPSDHHPIYLEFEII